MSKTDSLLRLLAILRFAVPSNSSRTLNATQAYDVTSSGITLASAIGKLVDKDVAVKTSAGDPRAVITGLSVTAAYPKAKGAFGAGKQNADVGFLSSNATLAVLPAAKDRQSTKVVASNFIFGGTSNGGTIPLFDLSNKPKATNPNTFFYGAITVGTGDYKKWQGKYAVLKINTVTGKGVLRIYDA